MGGSFWCRFQSAYVGASCVAIQVSTKITYLSKVSFLSSSQLSFAVRLQNPCAYELPLLGRAQLGCSVAEVVGLLFVAGVSRLLRAAGLSVAELMN